MIILNYQHHPHQIRPNHLISQISVRPRQLKDFERLENKLLPSNHDLSDYEKIVQKLSKGARACLYESEEARKEIESSKAATSVRHARYNMSRSTFRSKGIVSLSDVSGMKRDKQKLTELEAIDKLRPVWKKVMMELKRHCRQSGRRLKR